MIDLSIIIINWNSADYLINCIRTIKEHTHLRYEIIVVDNASYDGCMERLSDEHNDVIFLQSDENLGFAGGNNFGFKYASGSVLLFLNPDTEVLNGAIDQLYKWIRRLPDCGIVGARLLNSDGTLQTTCVRNFPTILGQILDSSIYRSICPKSKICGTNVLYQSTDTPSQVDAVSGACLMIKKYIFKSVGGFSSEYFMYSEDIDLCYKVRKAGYKIYYVPTAEIIHHGGASSSQSQTDFFAVVMIHRSRYQFFKRSRSPLYSKIYRLSVVVSSLLRIGLLLAAWPVMRSRGKGSGPKRRLKKWAAVLQWALALEPWDKERQ